MVGGGGGGGGVAAAAADVSLVVKFLPTGFKISLNLLLKGTYRKNFCFFE